MGLAACCLEAGSQAGFQILMGLNTLNIAKETKMQILSSLQTADQALTNLFLRHVIDTGGVVVREPFLFASEA